MSRYSQKEYEGWKRAPLDTIKDGQKIAVEHVNVERTLGSPFPTVYLREGTALVQRDVNGNRSVFFTDGDFVVQMESQRQYFVPDEGRAKDGRLG